MRAAILPGLNEKLEVRDDMSVVGPGPNEVHLRIAASGVCHSDLSAQDGTLPCPIPGVLGHEGAGEVLAVGDGVTELAPGDHVIVSWTPPCGKCSYCLGGQPNLCMTYLIEALTAQRFQMGDQTVGAMAGTGTFADEVVLPQVAAIKIPSDVPYDVASLIGCGVMTGVGAALNTAQVRPGSSVVVFGCGGVGVSVIQGARIAGAAEIIAVDLHDHKLESAKGFGATHGVKPDGLAELSGTLTGGQGFDYAFEVIGLPDTIRAAWDATRRGGTTVVVGAGRMEAMVSFNAFELFYSEKKLLGSFYGSADVRTDFHKLLRLWRAGKLDLESMITRRIDLSEINDAFDACKSGDVIRTVVEFK
ncbi:MAG: Zn-dependent alcohol dehydrogenase [Actinomycetota bacterium]